MVDAAASNRDAYARLDHALDAAGLGQSASFLNWGYRRVDGEVDEAVLPVGTGANALQERLVAELLGPTPLDRKRVLDIGCGRGGALAFMAERTRPLMLSGVDISPENVEQSRRALSSFGARIQVADACALPQADASQDVVFNLESSGAYADIVAFLGHVSRILRPGGLFAYGDLWPEDDLAPLRRVLNALGFEEISFRDVTQQVLAAREAAPPGVTERLRRVDPDLVEDIGDYFAVPGSSMWQRMSEGRIRYCLVRARRTREPGGGPSPADVLQLRGRTQRISDLLSAADSMAAAANDWFPLGAPSPEAAVNVLAFPFAAGGASVFRGWDTNLPPEIRFCPVQLPGREHRIGEPAFRSVEAVVDVLLPLLEPVRHRPLALVGWSLGCKIAFALAARLEQTGTVARLLMLGACPSPDRAIPRETMPQPGESWAEPLRRLGGTAESILAHEEMLGTLRESLEGDFAMAIGYRSEEVIGAPILAIAADADALVPPASVADWELRTSGGFRLRTLQGGHFAVRDNGPMLARLLATTLGRSATRPAVAIEEARAWLPFTPKPPRGRPQLICFHHAGGSAAFFRPWIEMSALSQVAVCPVELPGRGSRFGDAPCSDLAAVTQALSDVLAGYLDWSRPVILFGHSLGALIAYETALRLEECGLHPAHFVASARRAPSVPTPQPWRHDLSDEALIAELGRIGGSDSTVLQHRELMALLLPAVRADFALTDPYLRGTPRALDCPVLAIRGRGDVEIAEADVAGWRLASSVAYDEWHPDGDHFYLADDRTRTMLADRLAGLVAGAA